MKPKKILSSKPISGRIENEKNERDFFKKTGRSFKQSGLENVT